MTMSNAQMWALTEDGSQQATALAELLNRIEEAEEYLRLVYGNPRYMDTVQWRMAEHTLDILAGHPDGADA